MTKDHGEIFPAKYLNPVYPHSFPDPFVLKFRGEYFAYCTDVQPDGKVFGVLRSRDLVNWRYLGGAMTRLASEAPFYWAPEVTYANGKFYLYYSVGNETLMELRVAVADRPDGGFVDSGRRLTHEEFAIDAHVFTDDDGARYMFYATDFLTHTHIGTGTVVDRMSDFFTLEGKPRPVTRAKYDWQVYDPQRKEKGGVRWHTIEGSFVLKRKGVYYQMFSGGNWQNVTYGVSFAATCDIRGEDEWTQYSDGEKVFPILRTVPGTIVGPGHNSVVRGANNREIFCIYHRWTDGGRTLSIDRMDFAGGARMFVRGATHTPQPAPFAPRISDFFDAFSKENWQLVSGDWRIENNQLISGAAGRCEIACRAESESFLCETWLRAGENPNGGACGIELINGDRGIFRFLLMPGKIQATAVWLENGVPQSENFPLPVDFDFRAFHLLRLEIDERRLRITLDENVVRFEKVLATAASRISLVSDETEAAFSGFALTEGFEDLFESADLAANGWREIGAGGDCRIENGHLNLVSSAAPETIVAKRVASGDFEFAVNFRLVEISAEEFRLGFDPAFDEAGKSPLFALEKSAGGFVLKTESGAQAFALPAEFQIGGFYQIRFLRTGGKVTVELENVFLGEVGAPDGSGQIAISVKYGAVQIEMARFTSL